MALTPASSPLVLAGGLALFSLGLSPLFLLANDVIVGLAPPERAGAAAALSETGAELGGALGIALFGSLGTALYRSTLERLAPTDSSALAAARESLASAVALVKELPAPASAALGSSAREAFMVALHGASAGAAVLTFLLGILLFRVTPNGTLPSKQMTMAPSRNDA